MSRFEGAAFGANQVPRRRHDAFIRRAESEDLDRTRELFREYATWVGDAICFQAFERELAELPGCYAPPAGRLLLAWIDNQLAGCVALRRLACEQDRKADIGEMKRLYVREPFRGTGVGSLLVDKLVADARQAGYTLLRLDTLPRMERALAMYRALGFRQIPPYGGNPAEALCFEFSL